MSTRKLDEPKLNKEQCHNPEHDPPKMMVFEPGSYEHECPGCKMKQYFRINKGTLASNG